MFLGEKLMAKEKQADVEVKGRVAFYDSPEAKGKLFSCQVFFSDGTGFLYLSNGKVYSTSGEKTNLITGVSVTKISANILGRAAEIEYEDGRIETVACENMRILWKQNKPEGGVQ